MSRPARHAPGGFVYPVLHRTVARPALFPKDAAYDAFERVLAEALEKHPLRVRGSCLMPHHWQLVLGPFGDGDGTALVRWLTWTHTMRWHAHYHTLGTWPL